MKFLSREEISKLDLQEVNALIPECERIIAATGNSVENCIAADQIKFLRARKDDLLRGVSANPEIATTIAPDAPCLADRIGDGQRPKRELYNPSTFSDDGTSGIRIRL